MTSISLCDLKKLAAKKGFKKVTRMTSSEYRELLSVKGGTSLKKAKPRRMLKFSFSYDVEILKNGYKITLTGRHYSKNDINTFPRAKKFAYGTAIKKAAKECWLINKSKLKDIDRFTQATVAYYFYNPKSRDEGNNADTVKTFQDTFSPPAPGKPGVFGFIDDDNRKCLKVILPIEAEILCKEYKVEAYLYGGWKHETIERFKG